jgi:hypothetical protein
VGASKYLSQELLDAAFMSAESPRIPTSATVDQL